MVRGNRLSLLCASVVTMGLPAMVSARHMETWSPQELVDESDVIVVGEVESVIEGERIAEGETWRTPVVMMRAGVRVLRSTPSDGPHTPKPGGSGVWRRTAHLPHRFVVVHADRRVRRPGTFDRARYSSVWSTASSRRQSATSVYSSVVWIEA